MLPYVHVADLNILGIRLHPFGLLAVTAVMVGTALARWRARKRRLDLQKLESFIGWMLFMGFVSAHVLDAILYHPRDVLERPWSLLYFWEGIGSFSGFVGALAGIVLWKRFEWLPAHSFGPWKVGWFHFGPFTISRLVRRRETLPILPFADLILSVFPIAWIFGRTGCSIAHDHPGARAEEGAALAIAFPSPNPSVVDGAGAHTTFGPITFIEGHYPRYDLGTLELFVTLGIALTCVLLWRRRMLTGAYAVIVSLVYAPARFAMDFLRIQGTSGADPRYGRLTPAQWMCIMLFLFGFILFRYVALLKRRGVDPTHAVLAEITPTPG
ncbi:MAG: prolipoprotein diacylglyceryl transferase [Myxococcota bacterium]|nr:prolipoprotein diacylglyceryl transferase [Myxococcota bacterium]